MRAIALSRLFNQHIEATKFKSAADVVGWMGAMQAQDFAMAKWAVGIRLPHSTERSIEAALDSGEIIRTHLLRPTWHLVSAQDLTWMLALTAPQIKATLKSRQQGLGLSETVLAKSNTVLRQALGTGKHLTRQELVNELEKNQIVTDENRASHLLMCAELEGLICSGANQGKHPTYALLEERVAPTQALNRETALAKLARQYFVSHGPATLSDFIWWSGLSTREARQALEMVKADFVSETIGAERYWFPNATIHPEPTEKMVQFLPAFDEFIISYTDRSAVLPAENQAKAISSNGIFRPVIVVNGQVAGLWKRTLKKAKVIVEAEFFKRPDSTLLGPIEKAAERYGHFLEKETELICNF